ncbi:hypothetical protein N7490_004108 [Penicillium lividum]|nr:hypothetical protein N7490_004108 [Penicillium lividum]
MTSSLVSSAVSTWTGSSTAHSASASTAFSAMGSGSSIAASTAGSSVTGSSIAASVGRSGFFDSRLGDFLSRLYSGDLIHIFHGCGFNDRLFCYDLGNGLLDLSFLGGFDGSFTNLLLSDLWSGLLGGFDGSFGSGLFSGDIRDLGGGFLSLGSFFGSLNRSFSDLLLNWFGDALGSRLLSNLLNLSNGLSNGLSNSLVCSLSSGLVVNNLSGGLLSLGCFLKNFGDRGLDGGLGGAFSDRLLGNVLLHLRNSFNRFDSWLGNGFLRNLRGGLFDLGSLDLLGLGHLFSGFSSRGLRSGFDGLLDNLLRSLLGHSLWRRLGGGRFLHNRLSNSFLCGDFGHGLILGDLGGFLCLRGFLRSFGNRSFDSFDGLCGGLSLLGHWLWRRLGGGRFLRSRLSNGFFCGLGDRLLLGEFGSLFNNRGFSDGFDLSNWLWRGLSSFDGLCGGLSLLGHWLWRRLGGGRFLRSRLSNGFFCGLGDRLLLGEFGSLFNNRGFSDGFDLSNWLWRGFGRC